VRGIEKENRKGVESTPLELGERVTSLREGRSFHQDREFYDGQEIWGVKEKKYKGEGGPKGSKAAG